MIHPLVTVIIPVYNSEKTLRKCVDSILYMSFKDIELILVDDGSSDFSPTICDDYAAKDSRVRTFHKENGGVSSARNLGLDKAQGKWVVFIDSDDYVTDGYLDGVVGHDEDILFKGYKKFDNNGIVGGKGADELSDILFISDFISQYVTDSLLRGPVFKFYKRSLIGDLRFLPDMKIGEDAWFVFNYLAKCKSFAVLPKGEYMVRLAEEPDEVKYSISVDYAVRSLQYLKNAYDGLVREHHINKGIFLSYIVYFKRISQADWRQDRAKWYDNPDVKALYDYVWPALSFKQKARLVASRMLRR
jgi:glycosyltransferase involved in cell wall biosynthesis